jgi:hypothetical protein
MITFLKNIWKSIFEIKKPGLDNFQRASVTTDLFDYTDPDFCEWAFGKDYKYMSSIRKMENWNRLHGDLFKIAPKDEIFQSLNKMGLFWQEHLKKQNDKIDVAK